MIFKITGDAIDVEVNEGLLAFGTEEEGAVGGVVHEEVFGEDGGAGGVAEEVEIGLLVGVGVGVEGGEPAVASAGGVAVDGDEEDVVFAQPAAPLVHAAAALGQGDVRFLRHQERGVQAPGLKGGDDAAGEEPVLGVFQETAVGAPLALGVDAVAVVDEDLHS